MKKADDKCRLKFGTERVKGQLQQYSFITGWGEGIYDAICMSRACLIWRASLNSTRRHTTCTYELFRCSEKPVSHPNPHFIDETFRLFVFMSMCVSLPGFTDTCKIDEPYACLIWAASELGVRFRADKIGLRPSVIFISTDRFKAAYRLPFFFIYTWFCTSEGCAS